MTVIEVYGAISSPADAVMFGPPQGALDNLPGPRPQRLPRSIGADQVYYWTAKWQADEAEAMAELASGQGVTFSSATDAIRWLLDPSD